MSFAGIWTESKATGALYPSRFLGRTLSTAFSPQRRTRSWSRSTRKAMPVKLYGFITLKDMRPMEARKVKPDFLAPQAKTQPIQAPIWECTRRRCHSARWRKCGCGRMKMRFGPIIESKNAQLARDRSPKRGPF